jgi:hypothetical protein
MKNIIASLFFAVVLLDLTYGQGVTLQKNTFPSIDGLAISANLS